VTVLLSGSSKTPSDISKKTTTNFKNLYRAIRFPTPEISHRHTHPHDRVDSCAPLVSKALILNWESVFGRRVMGFEEGLRPHGGVADTYEYVSQEADNHKES
jgi:hypothetical protein